MRHSEENALLVGNSKQALGAIAINDYIKLNVKSKAKTQTLVDNGNSCMSNW